MIPAYKAVLFGSFGASMYMMTRMLLVRCCNQEVGEAINAMQGHKTWYGKN